MAKILEKYKELKASYDKVNEIRGSITHVASALKEMVRDSKREIESDTLLSSEGRQVKIAEAKKHFGKQFIQTAAKMKDEFQKSVVKVQVAAEVIANEIPQKPSEIQLKTYQRELADLKTELLLSTNPDTSLSAVKSFVNKQNDYYIAHELKQEFAGLAQSIIGVAGGDQSVKLKLRDVYGNLNDKSLMPEQKEAAQIAGSLANAFGENLYSERSIEFEAIRNSVGDEFARYANRPEHFPNTDETSAK